MRATIASKSSNVVLNNTLLRAAVAVVLVAASTACFDESAPAPVAETEPTVAARTPIRLGILLDKSGSTRENVVPGMSAAELEDAIAIADTPAGGEVAVGLLCNVSGDKPFVRLYLPGRPVATPATAPAGPVDPFTAMQQSKAANAAAEQQARAEADAVSVRQAEVDRFRAEALALIRAPVSCTRTDVAAGANRLTTYLAEPVVTKGGGMDSLRVAVFVTDGKDNVRRQTLRRDPGIDAAYLLVGGSEDAGALSPLNPARFESVTAALRWVQRAAAAQ